MGKIGFLFIAAVLLFASCKQPQNSNMNSNIQSNSSANQLNSNVLVNSSANVLQNTTPATPTSEVNTELLKQIENQQLETADPRKAANKSTNGNTKPPAVKNPSGSSQRQTW